MKKISKFILLILIMLFGAFYVGCTPNENEPEDPNTCEVEKPGEQEKPGEEQKPEEIIKVCPICEGLVSATNAHFGFLEAHTPTTFDATSVKEVKTVEVGVGVKQKTIEFKLNNGNNSRVVATEVDLTKASIVAGTKENSTVQTSVSKIIDQAKAYEEATNNKVLAAVNADFFGGNVCVNAFVKDGVIIKSAHNDNGSYDYTNLDADIPASMPLLFGVSGSTAQIASIIKNASVKDTIQSSLTYELLISSKDELNPVEENLVINGYIGTSDAVNLVYKTTRAATVYANSQVLKIKKHGENPLHGEIESVEVYAEEGRVKATNSYFYVVIPEALNVEGVEVGKYVSYHVTSADNTWRYYDTIIGCRQALVEDGKVSSTVKKENSNGAQSTNIPRTAIGIKPDGTVVIFSVEALRYGAKNYVDSDPYGLSLPQLADFMRYYGVYVGANFDGGGSTSLITRSGYNGSGDFEVIVRSSDYGTTSLTASRSVINSVLVVLKEGANNESGK